MNGILQQITSHHNLNLIEAQTLSGGDINAVFLLKCKEGNFVTKLNEASKFPGIFDAEIKGLRLLKNSKSFRIPEIVTTNVVDNYSYLVMEYISIGVPGKDFWELFAQHLAALHKSTKENFGLDHDNYIGSLQQYNKSCKTPSEFYITQRLEPQFKMASDNGFEFENLKSFYKNISEEIPNEPSSLIHGDLWNGNFLVSEKSQPVLIDPAVAYAPREMDLAMMKLFGRFPEEVFSNYSSIFPLTADWEKRIQLWQLYYLLVHLNLFGIAYLSKVKTIISKYS